MYAVQLHRARRGGWKSAEPQLDFSSFFFFKCNLVGFFFLALLPGSAERDGELMNPCHVHTFTVVTCLQSQTGRNFEPIPRWSPLAFTSACLMYQMQAFYTSCNLKSSRVKVFAEQLSTHFCDCELILLMHQISLCHMTFKKKIHKRLRVIISNYTHFNLCVSSLPPFESAPNSTICKPVVSHDICISGQRSQPGDTTTRQTAQLVSGL